MAATSPCYRPGRVSFAATEDGGAGFQLFVGEMRGPGHAGCPDPFVDRAGISRRSSPPLFKAKPFARLNDLNRRASGNLPGSLQTPPSPAGISHRFATARRPARARRLRLPTLISDHYGGERRDNADHVERFYFARELGGGALGALAEILAATASSAAPRWAEAANSFAATGRCSKAPAPEGATMVLVDCREWTRIVPALRPPPATVPRFFHREIARSRPGSP